MAGINAWDEEHWPVAMFVQEPFDPTKIPMYQKNRVYDNGQEFSLEEIRARCYITTDCTENKENFSSSHTLVGGKLISSQRKGTKEPIEKVFKPLTEIGNNQEDLLSDPDFLVEPANNLDLDVTSYTKAFNMPTSSSTPFLGNRKLTRPKEKGRESVECTESCIENVAVHEPEIVPVKELSVIEESSKENVVPSSGSVVSSTESDHPVNVKDHQIMPQVVSRIPRLITSDKSCESKSSIPTLVCRDAKDISVRYTSDSKQSISDQNLKDKIKLDESCEKFGAMSLCDPFDEGVIDDLLKSIRVPLANRKGFYSISHRIPFVKVNSDLLLKPEIGSDSHSLKSLKVIGQGSYAKVYKAVSSKWHKTVAIKLQKPPCKWEFYISKEIQNRIKDAVMKSCFMDVKEAYFYAEASILISDFMERGTLLDIVNLYKAQRKKIPEVLIAYFTIDVLRIVDCLHSCQIIHGDIKPDNFLVKNIPSMNSQSSGLIEPSLQLIDLGRCIDMSLFPKDISFKVTFKDEYFQCIEMRTKRRWTYQVDYYMIASLVYCLIFGEHMKVCCKEGTWNISQKVPRDMNLTFWNSFFINLLNIESCQNLPNIKAFLVSLQDHFCKLVNEFDRALSTFKSLLSNGGH